MVMKLAFLFPGQGAQFVGMGVDFAEKFKEAAAVFEKASDKLNIDILDICKVGPEEVLKDTRNTQPCIVTVSIAILEVFKKQFNLQPTYIAGHSVGEYSAISAGEILSFEDSVYLVTQRAKFMQDAADEFGKGSMAAVIGLDDDKVREICDEFGRDNIQPANFNSPGQVVVSGEKEKIEELMPKFKEAGAKLVKELSVSGPWHSRFMEPAIEKLKVVFSNFEFKDPNCFYIPNITAKPTKSGLEIKDLLIKQLNNPVLWTDSIKKIKDMEVDLCIEMGPGQVLTKLMKRIDREIQAVNISKLEDIEKVHALLDA